jgi:hypothetical protein
VNNVFKSQVALVESYTVRNRTRKRKEKNLNWKKVESGLIDIVSTHLNSWR